MIAMQRHIDFQGVRDVESLVWRSAGMDKLVSGRAKRTCFLAIWKYAFLHIIMKATRFS
jgi:hypothetical protein